jgi:adenylate cyclase
VEIGPPGDVTTPATGQTFIFADLAGFTALTEAHGDETAADLAAAFCDEVRSLLAVRRAHEVKAIGDALMIRGEEAAAAIELGLEIVERVGARPGFPSVRVGMHTGSAVERDGDWFGGAVNVAARVSAVASGAMVLLTRATRDAAGDVAGVDLRPHGRQALRNVAEPVEMFRAVRQGVRTDELPIDPVCRMAVHPAHRAGTLVYGGTEYQFCSFECVRSFAGAPERYVGGGR